MLALLYKPLLIVLVYITFQVILAYISNRMRFIDLSDIPTQARLARFRRGLDWIWFLVWVIEMILLIVLVFNLK